MEDVSHFITTSQKHPLLLSPNTCFRFVLIETKDHRPVLGFHGCNEAQGKGLKRHFKDVVAEWEKLNPTMKVCETSGFTYTWTLKKGLE